MSLYSLNQVACYLNLAASRIAKQGNISYLTDNAKDGLIGGAKQHQETQILLFGDPKSKSPTLWIANNDDADTHLQMNLLNKLGIITAESLIKHVSTYQGRLFKPSNYTKKNKDLCQEPTDPTGISLYQLALLEAESETLDYPKPLTLVENNTFNSEYQINLNNTPDSTKTLLFVTKSYIGLSPNTGEEHAEQKLLAALSKLSSVNETLYFYGCKPPCVACKHVLLLVEQNQSKLKLKLKYDNHNDGAKYPAVKNSTSDTIKKLDVDKYFPKLVIVKSDG